MCVGKIFFVFHHETQIEKKPQVELLNNSEIKRINQLIDSKTWPKGWDGSESNADKPFVQRFKDGSVQNNLFFTEKDLSI